VIGDEADVLAAERRKLLHFQNVEAGSYAARAPGALRSGVERRAK